MTRKIYFYGVLPQKGDPSGGGRTGNMRTVTNLKNAGYDMRIIRQIGARMSQGKISRMIKYPIKTLWSWIRFFSVLLLGDKKGIVHLAGFYGMNIYSEYVLLNIAKLLDYRFVYEMRGGGATQFYNEGSSLYRKLFAKVIKKCDFVFSQGMENKALIDSIVPSKHFFYYPNYVEDGFMPNEYMEKPDDKINMLFLGRIDTTKNIELVIDIVKELQTKYDNVTLSLMGTGSEEYVEKIRQKIDCDLIQGSAKMYGQCKHEDMSQYLSKMHFYIFPSTEPREGHSNALTEVMSWGVVPIASPQGFNRTVVGSNELIVDEMTVDNYVAAISKIIDNNEYGKWSRFCFDRVFHNYTNVIVCKKLVNEYNRIFENS